MEPYTWDTIGIRRDDADARRLWFEPFGDLDCLDMPHPVDEIRRARTRIYISTLAGHWFEVRNAEEPDRPYVADTMKWVVIALMEPPKAVGAVDPHAGDSGTPTPRDKPSSEDLR